MDCSLDGLKYGLKYGLIIGYVDDIPQVSELLLKGMDQFLGSWPGRGISTPAPGSNREQKQNEDLVG